MIAVYVDPIKTPLTVADAANAMRTALSAGRSELVRDDVLALALAKSGTVSRDSERRGFMVT